MSLPSRHWLIYLALAVVLGLAIVVGCHRAGRGAGPIQGGTTDVEPGQPLEAIPTSDSPPPQPVDGTSEAFESELVGMKTDYETASVGLGLAGITDWATEYPFLDFMKYSRVWYDWKKKKDFNRVNQDGWVERIQPGETPGIVFLTVYEHLPVRYPRMVVRWEGKGKLAYDWSAKLVESDPVGKRDVIEVGNFTALLNITETDPSDPIRNIKIVPEKFEKRLLAGEIFNPEWLARVRGTRAIRFMDWMGTNASTQKTWKGRPMPHHRSFHALPKGEGTQGVPLEVMVALANELDADPWFNMPHDSDEDYVRRFASYVKDNLEPHLTATVEYSNEVWNFAFVQSQYAIKKAEKLFKREGGEGWVQYGAYRASKVCDIWKKDVFKSESSRVHCTMGVHPGWDGLLPGTLDCPWAPEGHGKCYTHGFDSIATTGYFTGCLHGDESAEIVRSWFKDKDGGVRKAAEQVRDGRHFKCDDTVAHKEARYAFFSKAAKERNLQLIAYEGGQHVTANGHALEKDEDFTKLFVALNHSDQMGELYRQNFAAWKKAGGGLFMHFVDIESYSRYGSWGGLEHLGQKDSPKWHAIRDFNSTPCWWKDCKRKAPN